MTNAELYWDIAKFAIPMLVGLIAWAWRVELRLASHDRLFEAVTRIEKSLDELTGDHSKRSERLVRLETKLDLLLTSRQTARIMAQSREDNE